MWQGLLWGGIASVIMYCNQELYSQEYQGLIVITFIIAGFLSDVLFSLRDISRKLDTLIEKK